MKRMETMYSGIVIPDHGYRDTKTPKTPNLKTFMGIAIPKPDRLKICRNDEYIEDPSIVARVGMLEDSMSSLQAIVCSLSKMVEQILEVIECRATMNTLMKEVKHDIPKLEDKGHSTIIEHDKLNVGV
ncbi:hypothetical protein J1N35_034454 [Gossypium stocksii]|uniref:Uncharacterized protein n=1 Tax=Gossypium stocksii TaxID=47602 RepID=A0A9D3UTY8_9ROSI|nr:hypothetical protein J1N35_034454 [Gossypium stocksii]